MSTERKYRLAFIEHPGDWIGRTIQVFARRVLDRIGALTLANPKSSPTVRLIVALLEELG